MSNSGLLDHVVGIGGGAAGDVAADGAADQRGEVGGEVLDRGETLHTLQRSTDTHIHTESAGFRSDWTPGRAVVGAVDPTRGPD